MLAGGIAISERFPPGVSGAVRYFVSSFLNTDFFSFDIMINILACISTAALFGIIGYARRKDNA